MDEPEMRGTFASDLRAESDEDDDWRKGCPVCLALSDEACITPGGTPRKDHRARLEASRKEAKP